MQNILLLAGGLALLVIGGEMLVRGASQTAARLGMSPLLIGLTLVGFGTSTPELVTSVQASLAGSPGIAIGNIVGSNIANILLILGIAALITPIAVHETALKRDGVIVLATAVMFAAVGYLLPLDRVVGGLFVLGLVAYVAYAYLQERAGAPAGHTSAYDKQAARDEVFAPQRAGEGAPGDARPTAGKEAGGVGGPLLIALAGLAIVVVGGKLLVDGATGIARAAGISETVIGLTIVAVGTSLPEMVTSVIAAIRRHSDVALGNILGSNIYNILGIGGLTALIAPTAIPPEIVRFDNLIMVGVSLLMLLVATTGYRIGRLEGLVLVAGYVGYVALIWPK